jgi:guanosine-3',5'-bis(diphosphate) 3'-pyrophosphohydrolase
MIEQLTPALVFAAEKHRFQRRKTPTPPPSELLSEGCDGLIPYINHPLALLDILAREAAITDLEVLLAALLHDTLEDTFTTVDELRAQFGERVTALVQEVTDDKRLPKAERKREQVRHAPHLSPQAAQIKIADKIANLRDIISHPPDWDLARKQAYFAWAAEVVNAIPAPHPGLLALFQQAYQAQALISF